MNTSHIASQNFTLKESRPYKESTQVATFEAKKITLPSEPHAK